MSAKQEKELIKALKFAAPHAQNYWDKILCQAGGLSDAACDKYMAMPEFKKTKKAIAHMDKVLESLSAKARN